jgi:hypothetical protein
VMGGWGTGGGGFEFCGLGLCALLCCAVLCFVYVYTGDTGLTRQEQTPITNKHIYIHMCVWPAYHDQPNKNLQLLHEQYVSNVCGVLVSVVAKAEHAAAFLDQVCVCVCVDGWMDGWMDVCVWMDGWMDGWMDVCVCVCAWMDGWMCVCMCVCMWL